MKVISVLVLLLVVIAATRATRSHPGATAHPMPVRPAPTTTTGRTIPTATPAARPADTGRWVITDTYDDPEFARRTVICVDANGDLRTATGWREIDVPGGRINAPCPAGQVLDEGVFGPLTNGGDHR